MSVAASFLRVSRVRQVSEATAVLLLLVLPILAYGVPAVLGHPVLPGDDLTQNFPLRVLAGQQIRSGHLPLYDPYIWSGAPLLAGWNAGAAYSLTLLARTRPRAPGSGCWSPAARRAGSPRPRRVPPG
jgi:hypothetical protein